MVQQTHLFHKFTSPNNQTTTEKQVITLEDFKARLDRADTNHGDMISWSELREVLRRLALRYTSWKAFCAMRQINLYDDHFIVGDSDLIVLIEHMMNHWGIVVRPK